MESHYLQKEIFSKLNHIIRLTDLINKQLSQQLMHKSFDLDVELTQDLKDKCAHYIIEPEERTQYQCKTCFKRFDDGRKLGGHVSRAHKENLAKSPSSVTKRIRKPKRKFQEIEQQAQQDGSQVKLQENI